MLKHCIFNRDKSTTHILRVFFSLCQNIFISFVKFFGIETSCWIDLVGSVLAFEYFASSWDMFEDADFNVLMGRYIEVVVFAVSRVIKFGVIVHQRLIFINNIICYKKTCYFEKLVHKLVLNGLVDDNWWGEELTEKI